MIERIECFYADVQANMFGKTEFAARSQIELPHTKAHQRIASQNSLLFRICWEKCRGIQFSAARRVCIPDPERLVESHIRTERVAQVDSQIFFTLQRTDWKSAPRTNHGIHGPAVQKAGFIAGRRGERMT